MALDAPFSTAQTNYMLRANDTYVSADHDGFYSLGGLASVGETETDFNQFCESSRYLEDACEQDDRLAAHLAVLLNRAHALGRLDATAQPQSQNG